MTDATIEQPKTAREPLATDKLYMENTLLRISGALFCHDAKRAGSRIDEVELNRGVEDRRIVVRPDPKLGCPGPLAHKIFVALIKKHSDYGRPIQPDVSFTKRELTRLIGRTAWGGSAGDQIARALSEIQHTFVETNFKTGSGTFVEHSFNIFPEVYIERAERPTDPIERCTVTLARPVIDSLADDHFTCLNHGLMRELGTIGQALYMRLFFHFANLYDGRHPNRLVFRKRYDDLCAEWLGGLTVLRHRSKIVGEQLGLHLDRLARDGFLASWAVTKAKSGGASSAGMGGDAAPVRDAGGFVLTFRPGETFFADYDRFYRHRNQGELQFQFHGDKAAVAEPLKVAYLFAEKKTGKPLAGIPYVTSKDTETAAALLKRIGFEAMPAFFDFALAEARRTRFEIQTLGGVRQYLDGFLVGRERAAAAKAMAARRDAEEREEAERRAYEEFRAREAAELFATLPAGERAAIDDLVEADSARGSGRVPGSLSERVAAIARMRIAAERHPDRIPGFEAWKASQ